MGSKENLISKLEVSQRVKLFYLDVQKYRIECDIWTEDYILLDAKEHGPFATEEILNKNLNVMKELWEKEGYLERDKEEGVFYSTSRNHYEIKYWKKHISVYSNEIGEHKGKLYLFKEPIKEIIVDHHTY